MPPIVECSPNFSEGRRQDVIDAIVDAIRSSGVQVLTVQADPEQNRALVRFAGEPEAVLHAALAGAAVAAERIDLTQHSGTHPRIGAVDVIPFAPVAGLTVEDCALLARRLGEMLATTLDLPVYLYAEAALRPERRDLSAIREGQFEGLRDAIASDPLRAPDFGPMQLGTAGAVAVGARHPQIHVTVWLDVDDAEIAGQVAAGVDRRSGGLTHVEARVIEDADRGAALVVTLARADQTPLPRVVEALRREAARHGVRVVSTEILGPVPVAVLVDAASWYLQIEGFQPEQIIENHLIHPAPGANMSGPGRSDATPQAFVAAVAADGATPGGGSVAALAGALGAALCQMVAGLTVGRARYADAEGDMQQLRAAADRVQSDLLGLMSTDSAAFEAVMAAYRLPRATTEEATARRDAIQSALRTATEVPLEVMRYAVEVLHLAQTAAELGNASAVSDAGVAGYMALAAAQSASLNVDINITGLRNIEDGDRYRRENSDLLREARLLAEVVDRSARARIAGNP
jgi:glutamate formiminotransferase/formiminotetrahydrofolate cyclodeaminase